MPPDLRVPICTLIYAAPRLDVKELKQVTLRPLSLLCSKFSTL